MDDLASVPEKFGLPISAGSLRKTDASVRMKDDDFSQEEKDVSYHAIAFAMCTLEIEWALRTFYKDENALLISENNDLAKKMIKEVHASFKKEDLPERLLSRANVIQEMNCFPIKRIRDTVHFAAKDECRLLQLADVCAFVIRGHLIRHKHNPRFYELLRGQILHAPTDSERI